MGDKCGRRLGSINEATWNANAQTERKSQIGDIKDKETVNKDGWTKPQFGPKKFQKSYYSQTSTSVFSVLETSGCITIPERERNGNRYDTQNTVEIKEIGSLDVTPMRCDEPMEQTISTKSQNKYFAEDGIASPEKISHEDGKIEYSEPKFFPKKFQKSIYSLTSPSVFAVPVTSGRLLIPEKERNRNRYDTQSTVQIKEIINLDVTPMRRDEPMEQTISAESQNKYFVEDDVASPEKISHEDGKKEDAVIDSPESISHEYCEIEDVVKTLLENISHEVVKMEASPEIISHEDCKTEDAVIASPEKNSHEDVNIEEDVIALPEKISHEDANIEDSVPQFGPKIFQESYCSEPSTSVFAVLGTSGCFMIPERVGNGTDTQSTFEIKEIGSLGVIATSSDEPMEQTISAESQNKYFVEDVASPEKISHEDGKKEDFIIASPEEISQKYAKIEASRESISHEDGKMEDVVKTLRENISPEDVKMEDSMFQKGTKRKINEKTDFNKRVKTSDDDLERGNKILRRSRNNSPNDNKEPPLILRRPKRNIYRV